MTGTRGGTLGFDTFGTACGLAVIAGALALLVPTLAALTATLVALAVAGWAARHRRGGPPRYRSARSTLAELVPWLPLAAAAVLFVAPVAPWADARALLLGLGTVPVWVVERGGSGRWLRGRRSG